MTTPERFRRRQRIEGAVLIILGLLMLGQALYFNAADSRQRACVNDNFHELSLVLQRRADLVDRETEAARRVNLAELAVDTEAEFLYELRRYKREIDQIQQARSRNPLPPYPVGECD